MSGPEVLPFWSGGDLFSKTLLDCIPLQHPRRNVQGIKSNGKYLIYKLGPVFWSAGWNSPKFTITILSSDWFSNGKIGSRIIRI